jgi:hypothetical protein
MSVGMTAKLVDGKLAGTYTLGDGQATGGWSAKRK